jgi:hypothetical protein
MPPRSGRAGLFAQRAGYLAADDAGNCRRQHAGSAVLARRGLRARPSGIGTRLGPRDLAG